ncbi:iron-sulfur cluster biosynthesis transcriptional regulator SufR [Limnothrix redekei]|uniref:Iron-sulfur cluster biosynthesis transcriptional regulator SufR n=1 Tax=Limnothrix redekei LRLZ20PSL1 TaxID=3112953 RepID=A0ABW7CD31_9CYAN
MSALQQASTKHDILKYLLQQGEATAQRLAEALGISPQATRRHLKDLESEGLILHEAARGGTGRPQHLYRLSPAGRSQFPDNYDEFAVDLLHTLTETIGNDQVQSLLRQQWVRKALDYRRHLGAGNLRDRVARLVDLRRAEGYMAEWEAIEPEADGHPRYLLVEHNCAISTVAESYPGVCAHELEMFAIALQGCKVERTHWIVGGEHRCGYSIQESETTPAPATRTN